MAEALYDKNITKEALYVAGECFEIDFNELDPDQQQTIHDLKLHVRTGDLTVEQEHDGSIAIDNQELSQDEMDSFGIIEEDEIER